jgi:dTDP-glucose 4,6-dehydratase
MRILITGGRGTVGLALLYQLREEGHEVWTCDLVHHHDSNHFRCDVADFRQFTRLFDARGFDLVFHLAAEYGRWNGEDFYEQLWRTNVIGTKNILRLQERLGFKLVFTSTSEVYGDSEDIMTEDLMDRKEVRQLNDYAISKWVNELQIMNSSVQSGTETVRVRLFNIYGPGEYFTTYRSAICRFIYCALKNQPYTVFLNHTRSSIFISDAVRTLAALTTRFIPGEVYNIGGVENHTMKTVSDIILGHLGIDDSLVTYAESEPFTTHQKLIDTQKASRDLDHNPLVNLKDGLIQTIAWMHQVYIEKNNVDLVACMEKSV